MAERLIIVKLSDQDKISQITRILIKIPNLTGGVVQNQLNNLPWLLPAINDVPLMDSIQSQIELLGCTVQRQYVEDPGEVIEKKPVESTFQKKPEIDINRPLKRRPRPQPEAVTSVPAKPPEKNNYGKIIGTGVTLILLAGFFWLGSLKTGPASVDDNTSEAPNSPGSKGGRSNEGATQSNHEAGGGTGSRQGAVEKMTGSAASQSWYHLARKENILTRKESYLKKSLEHNQYNTNAWAEWVRALKKSGNPNRAKKIRKLAYNQNDKTRLALKSISDKFGIPEQPFDLTEEQFNIRLKMPEEKFKNIMDQGYLFYKEVEKLHGDKRLTVNFSGDAPTEYEMDVPPGKGQMNAERFKRYIHRLE